MNKILSQIVKRILGDNVLYGEIHLKLVFYNGNLTRYDYERKEINLIKGEEKT